jgi:hypothetical protein
MSKVEDIGRKIGNFSAEPETTDDQIAFSMTIPGGTLGENNKLRMTMFWKGRPSLPDAPIPIEEALNDECVTFTGAEQLIRVENHCGFFIELCSPTEYVGIDSTGAAYTVATYRDNAVGRALSGPAISVDPDSTREDFTGYAAIYDSQARRITLGKWINQPLSSIATSLGTANMKLKSGDVVKLAKKESTNQLTVAVNGLVYISVIDSDIPFSNDGFGIVGVGIAPPPTLPVAEIQDQASGCVEPGASVDVPPPAQNWSDFSVSCAEYVGSGPGGGATSGCCDEAPEGELSIQCCSETCEFSCDAAPGQSINLKACGGTPPYHWSSSDTAFVNPDYGDPNRAVATVAPVAVYWYAQVAYGIFVQPWPFADSDPREPPAPGCDIDKSESNIPVYFLRPFQAEYDCAGVWLRNTLCDGVGPGETKCPTTTEGVHGETTYANSVVLGSYCFRNFVYSKDYLSSFSFDGLSGGPIDPFHNREECDGRNDEQCKSPCFAGLHEGPCEFYVLTSRRNVGAPVVQVMVEDSLGATASVVIDVV